jgi:putative membrane protein
MQAHPRLPYLQLVIIGLAALWSFHRPHDVLTWWLEAIPVLIGIPLWVAYWKRFPWTPLACWAVWIHSLILLLGAHYTYAETPLGFWLQDAFDLSRNHYDRLGHVAQGFFPCIWTRELLIRHHVLTRRPFWLCFITLSICLAFSALYELIEWGAALGLQQSAEAFLATQGDVWDTQWDMFLALCGAALAWVLCSKIHDRQIQIFFATE